MEHKFLFEVLVSTILNFSIMGQITIAKVSPPSLYFKKESVLDSEETGVVLSMA